LGAIKRRIVWLSQSLTNAALAGIATLMAYVAANTISAKVQNNIMAHAVVRMPIVYAISLVNAGWFVIRDAAVADLAAFGSNKLPPKSRSVSGTRHDSPLKIKRRGVCNWLIRGIQTL